MRFHVAFEIRRRGQSPNPYRLVETTYTVDGPRSRLTSQTFPTAEAAWEAVEKLEADDDNSAFLPS